MLEAVSDHIPALLLYVSSAHDHSSDLRFGELKITSEEGLQQGDPLGSLLFGLTLARVLNQCSSEFAVG